MVGIIVTCFDGQMNLHAAVMDNPGNVRAVLSARDLCASLLFIDPDSVGYCQPNVELLYKTFHFALRLWNAGAVVPQIMTM